MTQIKTGETKDKMACFHDIVGSDLVGFAYSALPATAKYGKSPSPPEKKEWKNSSPQQLYILGNDDMPTLSVYERSSKTKSQGELPLGVKLYNNSASVMSNGTIYCFGGQSNDRRGEPNYISDTIYKINIKESKGQCVEKFVPKPITNAKAQVRRKDEKIVIVGGRTFENDYDVVCVKETFVFDPMTNEFETLPGLNTPRYDHQLVSFENSIYAFGGRDQNDLPLNSIERMVDGQKWETIDVTLVEPLSRMGCLSINGKVFLVGGENAQENLVSDISIFDVKNEKITSKQGKLKEMRVAPQLWQDKDDSVGVFGGECYQKGGERVQFKNNQYNSKSCDEKENLGKTLQQLFGKSTEDITIFS